LIRAQDNYKLDLATRQVAGNTQWTRVKAISRSRDCRVRVTSTTTYLVECLDPVWTTDQAYTMPRGFQILSTASPQFHKRGNAAPSATLTIWDVHSHSRQVVVNITGRVRVQ